MNHFEFEYPYIFLLLGLIFCIYRCPATLMQILFPHIQLFELKFGWFNREKLLYSLIFTLMVTALASPISYDQKSSQHRKGRDLVFVLDCSGSMAESGFNTKKSEESKFDLLKKIITQFIKDRYDDNVGVTLFGSYAFSSVPLTYDMKAVAYLLDFADVGIAGENTAIGDAIANATELLKMGQAKEKVMILVTDGEQNSGSLSPKDALTQALKEKIKIYTIGLGAKGSYDAALLKLISEKTGAKMFEAQDTDMLQNVYAQIDSLEPSKIRSQEYLNKHMLYPFALLPALMLLLYIARKRVR